MTVLWITRYILRTSAVRTNEFDLARGSPSICLEARIWLTLDEFSFGENLCFRHWREMARTNALSAHKFLASKVRNVGSEGRGWIAESPGKSCEFHENSSPHLYVCTWAREELMVILFTILPPHCERQHYFAQCVLQSTCELFYNVPCCKQHNFVKIKCLMQLIERVLSDRINFFLMRKLLEWLKQNYQRKCKQQASV